MEKVCQWEENLLHFHDQVAYSYQIHEERKRLSMKEKKVWIPAPNEV